ADGEGEVEIDIVGGALDRAVQLEGAELGRRRPAQSDELEQPRGVLRRDIELQVVMRIGGGQVDNAAGGAPLAAGEISNAGVGDGKVALLDRALQVQPAQGLAIEA